jgi:putative ABC transport system permease protein
MDTLRQDLRYAFRSLNRARGFALVAILTLALGIGANSAIFSVVNGVLLRPLPFAEPDQLVRVYNENREQAVNSGSFSIPDFNDLRSASGSVYSGVAGYLHQAFQSTARLVGEGRPEHLPLAWVSADFFKVLGVAPARGRVIGAEENTPGRDAVVVLSHSSWRNRFNADPAIVGKTIRLNGEPFVVLGVMPAGFGYPRPEIELYTPVSRLGPDDMGPLNRSNRWLAVIARMRPDVSDAAAAATTSQILARLEAENPESNKGWGNARVRGLQDVMVGDVQAALLVLLGVVAFVLLIACANLANLLLARSTTRAREIAVRTALGASRERIIRLVLSESLLLSIAGGALGFALSLWAVRVLVLMGGDTIPRAESIRPDASVVLFTLALAVATGILFGLVPAWRAARSAAAPTLREGGRGGTAGQERQRARGALVMIESALAVVLLVSAGLMIKSFYRLTHVDPGFESEPIVRIQFSVPGEVFEAPTGRDMVNQLSNYMRRMFDAIESVPGVVAVAASKTVPLQGGAEPYRFGLPDNPNPEALQGVGAYIISPGFFRTLGIPVLRGRDYTWNEQRAGLIVSRSLAARLWPNEDAIGKRLTIGTNAIEVIGVVGDVKNEGLAVDQTAAVYVSMFSSPRGNQNVFVRVNGNPAALLPALREAVWSVDPTQAFRNIGTMRDVKSETVARPQFFMTLIALFGALALTLAAIGMYGVISYTMRQRTAEIGVRMALGADAMQVYRLVVGKALQLAGIGVAAGLVGALLLTQLMRTLLFGVAPTDPLSLVAAAVVLMLTAFLAAFLPARRAARIPPSVAFRSD